MAHLLSPEVEAERIENLKKYNILDTPADGSFDRITELASSIFNVPVAIVSLVDTDRIWFKSHYGLPVNQIDRTPGLCSSAIMSDDVYVIENAKEDARTLSNALVAGEFGLGFYAAVPLQTQDNYNLGTLCIIDKKPRVFTDAEKEILKQLAAIVINEMEMRLAVRTAVSNVKKLTSDVSTQLNLAVENLEALPEDKQHPDLHSYLDSSRMFLKNIERGLDQL